MSMEIVEFYLEDISSMDNGGFMYFYGYYATLNLKILDTDFYYIYSGTYNF